MVFLWYLFHLLILVNYSISDQLCIDKCEFQYDFNSNFSLPSDCNTTRRNRCFVLTQFDYIKKIIKIDFSLEPDEIHLDTDNQTDTRVRSYINLANPSFIQHSIDYFCSTDNYCDLEFVRNIALSILTPKSCTKFRSQLIQYLNPDPQSTDRDCYRSENTTFKCDKPCELIYKNPNETVRSCDGQLKLEFQTTVGQSTPIDKPEYQYRTWSFSCTSQLCNGQSMQQRVENLIDFDHGECMISFKETNETTTALPSKSASIYSQLFSLFIFIMFFLF